MPEFRKTRLFKQQVARALAVVILNLAMPMPKTHAQCTGQCGDVNSDGSFGAADALLLFTYLSSADSVGMDLQCADVDDYAGVCLHDLVFILKTLYQFGVFLDCEIDNGPFEPSNHPGYLLHYNSVFPAGDTAVGLNIDATFGSDDTTQAVALVVQVRVDGEIPILADVVPTAVAGGPANWEVVRFNGPGTGNIPSGLLMGLFLSYDPVSPGPGRYPLGRAKLLMPASAAPRTITIELVEFPPGSNKTMVQDGYWLDTDVWTLSPAPWIVDLTGDVDNDRAITAADVIGLVSYVFKGGAVPYPYAASGDVNCSGFVNSTDIIELVNYIFKGGSTPCDVASECTLTTTGWTCP